RTPHGHARPEPLTVRKASARNRRRGQYRARGDRWAARRRGHLPDPDHQQPREAGRSTARGTGSAPRALTVTTRGSNGARCQARGNLQAAAGRLSRAQVVVRATPDLGTLIGAAIWALVRAHPNIGLDADATWIRQRRHTARVQHPTRA